MASRQSRKKFPKRKELKRVPRKRIGKASRKQLTDARKSVAVAKKRATATKRRVTAYKQLAKSLGSFSPDMIKLSRKRHLSPADKARITKRAKRLHNVTDLFKATATSAKKFKDYLYPGTQAFRFRNTSPNAKVNTSGDDLIVTSNGRTWIYWTLDRATVRNRKDKLSLAAAKAFTGQFPIETVADLADKAFKELKVEAVTIWTQQGRADQTFSSLRQFMIWISQHWQAGKYVRTDAQTGEIHDESDPGKWINGLAILLREPKKSVTTVRSRVKRKKRKVKK